MIVSDSDIKKNEILSLASELIEVKILWQAKQARIRETDVMFSLLCETNMACEYEYVCRHMHTHVVCRRYIEKRKRRGKMGKENMRR